MEFFYIYCLFAVTTSLTSLYELVYPVVHKRRKDDTKLENVFLYYITFFFLNTLAAPLVFLSCVIPEWGIRFRETLETALFEEQKT